VIGCDVRAKGEQKFTGRKDTNQSAVVKKKSVKMVIACQLCQLICMTKCGRIKDISIVRRHVLILSIECRIEKIQGYKYDALLLSLTQDWSHLFFIPSIQIDVDFCKENDEEFK
jgi:hypothetical protein